MEQGGSPAMLIISLILFVVLIIADWKIFEKAGEAGWKAIIPIYNLCILSKICTGSMVKWLLVLIPLFGIVYAFILNYKLVKAFGKGVGFFIGMLFLSPIFTLILAFDSSEYIGPQ